LNKKIKIGIYGGSFNPIHVGHVQVCSYVMNGLVDGLVVIPCINHAFGKGYVAYKHRMEMARISIPPNSNMSVLDERKIVHWAESEGLKPVDSLKSHTIYTVEFLKQTTLKEILEFHLIIGEDLVDELGEWKDIEIIRKNTKLIVVPRNKGIIKEADSTNIRNLFKQEPDCFWDGNAEPNKILKDLVPSPVIQYIIENKLYKKGL
jgi:nicotinate-nucleotide adenylyltransferase